MAEKKLFKIPSAKEIEDNCDSLLAKSLFSKYKSSTDSSKLTVGNVEKSSVIKSVNNSSESTANKLSKRAFESNKVSQNFIAPNGDNISLERHITSSTSSQLNDESRLINDSTKSFSQQPLTDNLAKEKEVPSCSALPSFTAPTISETARASKASIIVSSRQRGNPILKHIRCVPWEFGDCVADYEFNRMTCALFLSVRYHQLNPNYVHERLKQLGHSYSLRILLVQVDVKEPHHVIRELSRICILASCTLILAFSTEEAGRYLETFKSFENKPPDLIMEKPEGEHNDRVIDCLTTVRKVNKRDGATLLATFGSFAGIVAASEEQISLVHGIGKQKAKRLHDAFHEPFKRKKLL